VKELVDQVAFTQVGIQVTQNWMQRLLKKIGYSNKKPTLRKREKYTLPNLQRYFMFVETIPKLPRMSIKVVDEASYCSSDFKRVNTYGPRNQRVLAFNNAPLGASINITLLTTPHSAHPVTITHRASTNNAIAFINNILFFARNEHLVDGDYLILDNARIHHSRQIEIFFGSLMRALGVNIIFLPSYSPELSPCEPVFSQSKNYVNNRVRPIRETVDQFFQSIIASFSLITHNNILNYYDYCLNGHQGV